MVRIFGVSALLTVVVLFTQPAPAQINFGFDNRKPSGQEYLTPAESLKRLQVPPGWEVKLVAAEPDVINPIAFTIDERGRIWVVECFEYPKRTPKGSKPRDRIKIIEEDPNGGRPKVTVFAEGKDLPIGWDLASGIEVGHGGVFLGAPPYLFFLQDTDGDGKCDKQEILLKGFGSHDTHETLNTFQWGPDSKLYGLHGVFTHSDVEGVKLNAAVWRYQPTPLALLAPPLAPKGRGAGERGKFDIFAEGTSNPWGMDFDSRGNCFLACCVIPHLFHMVPGGTYKRQAGGSFNPYAYGLLNEICDHEHHKQSGWAHAGLLFLDGAHVPENYRGSLIMGSIHGTCIKRDVLRPNGSTFTASCAPDFLTSGDKNFRPINLRWGPDGSIYVIDWHDQNPCHQAAPDAWDYERGRIYKIQRQGAKPLDPGDLAKLPSDRLVELLAKDNPWWYRTALRLLHERRDPEVVPQLKNEFLKSANELFVLRGLWALYAVGGFNETIAAETLGHKSPDVRAWTIRLLGESGNVSDAILKRFTDMAAHDRAPQVRLQLASTSQRLKKQDTLALLHNLMKHAQDAKDPCLPLMIWLAYEPRVVPAPPQKEKGHASLDWLKRNAPGNPLVTNDIVPRTMRRLASTGKGEDLDACVAFLADVNDGAVRRQALEGLVQAFKNRQVDAPAAWKRVFAELQKNFVRPRAARYTARSGAGSSRQGVADLAQAARGG
jgi:putative membrane-bound dehydrogenase-like protein